MTSSEQLDTGIEERFAEQQARLAAMSFPRLRRPEQERSRL
jgi:hypothetical protein